jgi:hypothetical protein
MSELTSHYALLLGLQRRAPTRTLNASTSADVAYYKTPDFFFSTRFEMDKTEKPTDIDGYIARLQNYKKIVRANLRQIQGRSFPGLHVHLIMVSR